MEDLEVNWLIQVNKEFEYTAERSFRNTEDEKVSSYELQEPDTRSSKLAARNSQLATCNLKHRK